MGCLRFILQLMLMLLLLMLSYAPWCSNSHPHDDRLLVNMTLVSRARATLLGAYCLDGSLPAYHLHRGFGSGARNWLLQFEGGGWCNDVESCIERAQTRRGSTRYMSKQEVFSGILSNNQTLNPVGARKVPSRRTDRLDKAFSIVNPHQCESRKVECPCFC